MRNSFNMIGNNKPVEQLVSFHVVERESSSSSESLWRVSYPSIDTHLRSYIERNCLTDTDNANHHDDGCIPTFRYYHHRLWIYLHTHELTSSKPSSSSSSSSKQFSLIIISNDFNPEKYEAFMLVLSKAYRKHADYRKLLALYLSVMIEGSCNFEENGAFMYAEFDQLKVMAAHSPIKAIIKMFGLDIILIYTALILKRKICVYHHKLEKLLQFSRALPALVWHRHSWDTILYPISDLSCREDIDELQSQSHYIAGFLESDIENHPKLYDVFINLAAIEITVSHEAKDVFSMTKTHKEIAVFMTRQAESKTNSDLDAIKEIMGKTKELINTLKSMGRRDDAGEQENGGIEGVENEASGGEEKVSLEAIKSKKLSPALENFLWNLAKAENLV